MQTLKKQLYLDHEFERQIGTNTSLITLLKFSDKLLTNIADGLESDSEDENQINYYYYSDDTQTGFNYPIENELANYPNKVSQYYTLTPSLAVKKS